MKVLLPLKLRQRKHSVLFYEAIAGSEDAAIEMVRDRCQEDGKRIVSCVEAGDAAGARLTSAITCTVQQAKEMHDV